MIAIAAAIINIDATANPWSDSTNLDALSIN